MPFPLVLLTLLVRPVIPVLLIPLILLVLPVLLVLLVLLCPFRLAAALFSPKRYAGLRFLVPPVAGRVGPRSCSLSAGARALPNSHKNAPLHYLSGESKNLHFNSHKTVPQSLPVHGRAKRFAAAVGSLSDKSMHNTSELVGTESDRPDIMPYAVPARFSA